jgi:hypothetical protein
VEEFGVGHEGRRLRWSVPSHCIVSGGGRGGWEVWMGGRVRQTNILRADRYAFAS